MTGRVSPKPKDRLMSLSFIFPNPVLIIIRDYTPLGTEIPLRGLLGPARQCQSWSICTLLSEECENTAYVEWFLENAIGNVKYHGEEQASPPWFILTRTCYFIHAVNRSSKRKQLIEWMRGRGWDDIVSKIETKLPKVIRVKSGGSYPDNRGIYAWGCSARCAIRNKDSYILRRIKLSDVWEMIPKYGDIDLLEHLARDKGDQHLVIQCILSCEDRNKIDKWIEKLGVADQLTDGEYIEYAARGGHVDIVEGILAKGCSKDSILGFHSALCGAANNRTDKSEIIIRLVIERMKEVGIESEEIAAMMPQPIEYALKGRNLNTVKILHQYCGRRTASPKHLVAWGKGILLNPEMLRYFIDKIATSLGEEDRYCILTYHIELNDDTARVAFELLNPDSKMADRMLQDTTIHLPGWALVELFARGSRKDKLLVPSHMRWTPDVILGLLENKLFIEDNIVDGLRLAEKGNIRALRALRALTDVKGEMTAS